MKRRIHRPESWIHENYFCTNDIDITAQGPPLDIPIFGPLGGLKLTPGPDGKASQTLIYLRFPITLFIQWYVVLGDDDKFKKKCKNFSMASDSTPVWILAATDSRRSLTSSEGQERLRVDVSWYYYWKWWNFPKIAWNWVFHLLFIFGFNTPRRNSTLLVMFRSTHFFETFVVCPTPPKTMRLIACNEWCRRDK